MNTSIATRSYALLSILGLLAAWLVVSAGPAVGQSTLTVTYLDVGQADATLLEQGDTTILIDTGDWRRTDVVDHLTSSGIDQLDLVIVTHPHADHIGQFDRVMDAIDVDEVWWSGATTTTQTFQRALDALEASDAAYEEPRAGDTATFGDLFIEVVNPPTGVNLNNLHDANLAMRVTHGDVRFLFTGDAESSTEARMVSQSASQLNADIYQVGHHGSNTSTTASFLAAVDPDVAIYSAGAGNQYGHPHDEVINRLTTAGATVYGTDINGTVTVTSDGNNYTVTPAIGTATDGSGSAANDGSLSDIAGNTHEANIRRIVDAGTAGGFADGTYRPSAPVTRGQMATFIANTVNPPAYQPPEAGDITCVDINSADVETLQEIAHIGSDRAQELVSLRPFNSVEQMGRITGIGPARLQDIIDEGLAATSCPDGTGGGTAGPPVSDVAGTTHEDNILAVVQAGIAGGFADGTYQPGGTVTRGQMATFITNAFDLPSGSATFPDIAGTTHEANIRAVASAGIAGGFADGTYGPGQPVTRGQMATFIANALDRD